MLPLDRDVTKPRSRNLLFIVDIAIVKCAQLMLFWFLPILQIGSIVNTSFGWRHVYQPMLTVRLTYWASQVTRFYCGTIFFWKSLWYRHINKNCFVLTGMLSTCRIVAQFFLITCDTKISINYANQSSIKIDQFHKFAKFTHYRF